MVTIPLRKLRDGDYTVRWSVLSDDGHTIDGVFAFAVGAGRAPPTAALSAGGTNLTRNVISRWFFFAGLLVAVGVALFVPLAWRPALRAAGAEPDERVLWPLAFAGFFLTFLGASTLIPHHDPGTTRFGLAYEVGGIVAVVGATLSAIAFVDRRFGRGAFVCALALLPIPSVAGHALDRGQWPRPLNVAADILHVGAAAVWIGGSAGAGDRAAPRGAEAFARTARSLHGGARATAVRHRARLGRSDRGDRADPGALGALRSEPALELWLWAGAPRQDRSSGSGGLTRLDQPLSARAEAAPRGSAPERRGGARSARRSRGRGRVPDRISRRAGSSPPRSPVRGRPSRSPPLRRVQPCSPGNRATARSGSRSAPAGSSRRPCSAPTTTVSTASRSPSAPGQNGRRDRLRARCYRANARIDARRVEVLLGSGPVPFVIPGPTQPASRLVAEARRAFTSLRSLVIHERLASSPSEKLTTTFRIVAPDRLTYVTSAGARAIVIGGQRWDADGKGPLLRSAQTPLQLPGAEWSPRWLNARALGWTRVGGWRARRVSFFDPGLPAWFEIAVDPSTHRPLELNMTAAAHFMHHRYTNFNQPMRIVPPLDAGEGTRTLTPPEETRREVP